MGLEEEEETAAVAAWNLGMDGEGDAVDETF